MTAISIDNALGVHERSLYLRTQRSSILANNLANVDTPGFKARDFDFHRALVGAQNSSNGLTMARTHSGHLGSSKVGGLDVPLEYRVPLQPSIDGNTVDSQMEIAEFTKNAMAFGASFRLLNGRFSGLSKAISSR